jgi:hypothetical protein
MKSFPNAKITVEECPRISINDIKKSNQLRHGDMTKINWPKLGISLTVAISIKNSTPRAAFLINRLPYSTGMKPLSIAKTRLLSTPCHFGGERYWFSCYSCSKRVGIVYFPPGAPFFLCRHCCNLSYQSRNTSGKRGKWAHLEAMFAMDDAEEAVKNKFYAGKPTRRYRKYLKLQRRFIGTYAQKLQDGGA